MDYERVAGMLEKTFGWAIRRTFSREEAEELTQEIMFQAVKSLGELRDITKFEPWFWRIAEITLKVFRRGRAKTRSWMSFNAAAGMAIEDEHDFEADEEYQNLRRKIAQMSAAYRDIIVMHYYDNMSCKAVSLKLGLPEGTVTYRLSLARSKLKERCDQMEETALRPAKLKIGIFGDGNYNGESRPFPSQYIDDALSQNILWHAYREPKSVEELSRLTGVPAFYIEDRVDNLVRREAVIQPTKATVQTNFLIFDEKNDEYAIEHTGEVVDAVSEKFFELSVQLTEKALSSGISTAGRSFDEILCLLSVMLLDKFVPDYKPCEYKRLRKRYDGFEWDYLGFLQSGSGKPVSGVGINRSENAVGGGVLAHTCYELSRTMAPFAHRRMMYTPEIDVCHAILQKEELTENQKETAAKLIAEGYLAKDSQGEAAFSMPYFTKEQYNEFCASAKEIFADFLTFYSGQIKRYLNGYLKLFPNHLKDAANRSGFAVFIGMYGAIAADWLDRGKISIPRGALCDALVMMQQ